MRKPIFLLLALLSAQAFVACKKDSTDAPNNALTNGRWRAIASTATITVGTINQTVDALAMLPGCERDNFFIFQAGGTLITDEGATKCNSSAPQQTTGTWLLTQNDTRLVVASSGYNFDAEIVELNASKLRVKYTTTVSGAPASFDTTFENF
ncbi:MAG: lipocalin family protein [Saprospiraceae bacterium]|nr:lipocalin family protein [Saprospiraceae bacterium]